LADTDLDNALHDKQLQSHYLYVDNRPISLSRNPGKHILKLLREANPNVSTNSFVYLNVHCDVEQVKYDCNLDPAKSEVLFERFDFICDCFTKFLRTLENGRIAAVRSPSPCMEFFPRAQLDSRLPSPPPSSPVIPLRNVYAVNESEFHQPSAVQPRKDNLRQTRLEEYRSGYVTAEPPEKTVNRVKKLVLPTEIRSAMEYTTGIGEIDMTEGIVSSRKPRESEISELSDITPQIQQAQNNLANIARYGLPDVIDDEPVQARTKRREPKARNSSTTPNFKPPASPRNPRSHKSQSLSSPPVLPPPPAVAIKQRSLSDSPLNVASNTFDTSLNPWTIAAMNPPSKRQRILPGTYCEPTGRSVPRADDNSEDRFENKVGLDLGLQKRILVCQVSLEEVAVGQVMMLNNVPPPCDLNDYLLQYCSSY
jgi:DNA mismatch repair ATPase MutL